MIPTLLQAVTAPPTDSPASVLAWVCGGLVALLSVEAYVIRALFTDLRSELTAAAARERANAEANLKVADALQEIAATSERCLAKSRPDLVERVEAWLQNVNAKGGK